MNNGVVTLYRGLDVCMSDSLSLTKGIYQIGTMWKPVLAKIGPLTKLTIYTDVLQQNSKVYNNTYDDRYVVVKIDDPISYVSISLFERELEHMNGSTYVSDTDVIIIFLLIVSVLILLKKQYY